MAREPDMSDSELWGEYRRAQQERRADRLPQRTIEIEGLRAKGFDVVRLSDYQFRIDGALDLYPIHRRYHAITTGKRGAYQNALACAVTHLRRPA